MSFNMCQQIPSCNWKARTEIYEGHIFQISSTPPSLLLVNMVYELLHQKLGSQPRYAEQNLEPSLFFSIMGEIRKDIYTSSKYHRIIRDCIASLGFDNEHIAFDPARLRIINHNGHHNPLAAPVYYPHRDIWYGHPSSLITWWIPLDDLSEEETFEFYPEKFSQPVPNSSEIFDYDQWIAQGWDLKIGWQRVLEEDRFQYPSVLGNPKRGQSLGFSCKRGENILFSGAHFHATKPQSFHRTRFSLDFRVVDMRDILQKRGAPIVDDDSKGTAVQDYIQPGKTQWNVVPVL